MSDGTPGPIVRGCLKLSEAIYGMALLRYPADLRRRYGDDMRAAFASQARSLVHERGLTGLVILWSRTVKDILRPLPAPLPSTPSRRSRESRGLGLREDLASAYRSLRRDPRFTLLVVGVLGVGIALNVVAFSVLNAYLLRPLPFPEADRLVQVRNGGALSWRDVDEVFETAVSWDLDVFTIVGDGRPGLAPGAWVTPGFLETYGIQAQVGRTFRLDEAGEVGSPVAMISHRLWQERFGGDPRIVGRTFQAFTSDRPDHAELFTVVGVLPRDFWYMNEYTEVLAPIRDDRAVYAGRLRRDVPPARAGVMLTELAIQRMEEVPPDFRVEVEGMQERHVASVRPTLVVLQVAVLLVLLIASANAAVLLMVRSTRRQRELGLRQALGASGSRISRQLFAEGGLVAASSGAVGLALAVLALSAGGAGVEGRLGLSVPGGAQALFVDGTVLSGTLTLTLIIALTFGLLPVTTSLPRALESLLGEARGDGNESPRRRRARSAMVAAEIALSLALLTGAGLMVRSAVHLQRQDLGFDATGIVKGVMGLRQASYPEPEERVAVFQRLRDALSEVPGVEGVGLASSTLFATRFAGRPIEGMAEGEVARAQAVRWTVDEEYFRVMDMELLRGRPFRTTDVVGSERVAVVSESLARALWGDADPVGRILRMMPLGVPGTEEEPGEWLRVTGVVADVRREVRPEPMGDIYFSYRQTAPHWMSAFVRLRGEPSDVEEQLQAAVAGVDGEVPLASVERLDEIVDEAMEPTRYLAWLLAGFSAFALLLATLGLYGVVSYAVRQRRKTIAVRMALGADRASVVSLFLREGAAVVAAGLAVGTVGGVALGNVLESRLVGVEPGDPATHTLLALVLGVSALAAVWVPARRAAASDPMRVLRED